MSRPVSRTCLLTPLPCRCEASRRAGSCKARPGLLRALGTTTYSSCTQILSCPALVSAAPMAEAVSRKGHSWPAEYNSSWATGTDLSTGTVQKGSTTSTRRASTTDEHRRPADRSLSSYGQRADFRGHHRTSPTTGIPHREQSKTCKASTWPPPRASPRAIASLPLQHNLTPEQRPLEHVKHHAHTDRDVDLPSNN